LAAAFGLTDFSVTLESVRSSGFDSGLEAAAGFFGSAANLEAAAAAAASFLVTFGVTSFFSSGAFFSAAVFLATGFFFSTGVIAGTVAVADAVLLTPAALFSYEAFTLCSMSFLDIS
jgi:hypothetical protein